MIELGICNDEVVISSDGRYFTSRDGDDYSQLGNCIGRNTNLKTLYVKLDSIGLSATDSGFFDGIKQNSSIDKFKLSGYSGDIRHPIGEVGCELLKAFRENNSCNLTDLRIWCCDISSIDERVIINTTLRRCTNLKTLHFNYNNLTCEELLPMVEAIKGNSSLQRLSLFSNRIRNVGCETLATLLQDPTCNLVTLDLHDNQTGNEGAIAIANSLANNNKLKKLNLNRNEMGIQSLVEDAFSRVLCNTTSINDIYSSNHSLETLSLSTLSRDSLAFLLQLNEGTNKNQVAIRKILRYHPSIDMEPFFEWGSEDGRNLMALPYVVDWFDRAGESVGDDESGESSDDSSKSDHSSVFSVSDDYDYQVKKKKLTAIYQFALAMPVLFVPPSHTKVNDKKRKRVT